jgi:hypothetical protein
MRCEVKGWDRSCGASVGSRPGWKVEVGRNRTNTRNILIQRLARMKITSLQDRKILEGK